MSPLRHIARGFTLVEILIVSSLITLLSGIAIFSINEMYNSNIRKATVAECFQLASALSFAENDVAFFPRVHHLNVSIKLLTGGSTTLITPRLDNYGYLSAQPPILRRIQSGWRGPYMGTSPPRDRGFRGRGGFIKMRLPDLGPGFDAISLVDWPADPYAQPYLHYQFKTDFSPPAGVNFPYAIISSESDEPDFLNATVSYGRNGIPGGNENTNDITFFDSQRAGSLVVEGDRFNAGVGGVADFTLRVADPDGFASGSPNLLLTTNTVLDSILATFNVPTGTLDIDNGIVGMLDRGNDDAMIKF